MNGRVAKVLRKIAREKATQFNAPGRDLIQQPGNKSTAINHPATARGIYRKLKAAYRKGL